jgi:hypothetical protein
MVSDNGCWTMLLGGNYGGYRALILPPAKRTVSKQHHVFNTTFKRLMISVHNGSLHNATCSICLETIDLGTLWEHLVRNHSPL